MTTTTPPIEDTQQAGCQPRMVRLVQCARRSCAYVLTEDEYMWGRDPEWECGKTATCPKCGCAAFYTLNEKGQQITTRDREKYRDGLDPATIEPSPRMGLLMRRRILAAKRRALEANAQTLATPQTTP